MRRPRAIGSGFRSTGPDPVGRRFSLKIERSKCPEYRFR